MKILCKIGQGVGCTQLFEIFLCVNESPTIVFPQRPSASLRFHAALCVFFCVGVAFSVWNGAPKLLGLPRSVVNVNYNFPSATIKMTPITRGVLDGLFVVRG